jgi:hypothetical protein
MKQSVFVPCPLDDASLGFNFAFQAMQDAIKLSSFTTLRRVELIKAIEELSTIAFNKTQIDGVPDGKRSKIFARYFFVLRKIEIIFAHSITCFLCTILAEYKCREALVRAMQSNFAGVSSFAEEWLFLVTAKMRKMALCSDMSE